MPSDRRPRPRRKCLRAMRMEGGAPDEQPRSAPQWNLVAVPWDAKCHRKGEPVCPKTFYRCLAYEGIGRRG